MKISVQKQHPKPLHLLSHQHKEVEVRREKKKPRRPESIWEVRSTAVQRLLKKKHEENEEATLFSPTNEWSLPAPSVIEKGAK